MICLFKVGQKSILCDIIGSMYEPQDTLGVNDEETTKGNALLLEEDTVVAGDLHVPVGDEGEGEVRAEATLLAGLGGPGEVRVLRVGGNSCQ